MKILPLVNNIKNDITSSGVRLKEATSTGYEIANRSAKIHKQTSFIKYINITRSITNKVVKSTKKEDIPYVAGAIGMFIPLPLTSPLLLGLGFLLRFSIPDTAFFDNNETEKKDFNEVV